MCGLFSDIFLNYKERGREREKEKGREREGEREGRQRERKEICSTLKITVESTS